MTEQNQKARCRKRMSAVRQLLNDEKMDALLIFSRENTRYYSGFSGTESLLLISREAAHILVDFRYQEQAARQAADFTQVDYSCKRELALEPLLEQLQVGQLAVESEQIPYNLGCRLLAIRPKMDLIPFDDELAGLRSVKDDSEIERMIMATRIAEQALQDILPLIRKDRSECEIAAALEYAMRSQGASGTAFSTIVASGPRSALPHGLASDRKLQPGDAVVIDFGCQYQGYLSDMTRTFFIEQASERDRHIYQTVLAAQEQAIRSLRAGLSGSEVDRQARSLIEAAGYGPNFGHGLGHGVGLAIHETPRLAASWQNPLLPGQIVTVEPGIYLPGEIGVRIEDMAMVKTDGCQVFNRFGKALQVLPG